jgi:putative beta-barrel porin BBP2
MMPTPRILLTLALAAAIPASVAAQVVPPPDESQLRVRLGPLYLNPTLTLTNAGIDTNVFNDADADHPQSDFTATISPKTDIWMRLGRTWVNGVINEDLAWYKKFASERSASENYKLNWVVPLTRIAFSVGGDWLSTRDRPGFEIDARAQRSETAYNGAVELRSLSRTYVGLRGEHRTVSFDRGATFLDVNLRDELNRTSTTGAVTVRNQLTPLTSFMIDVARKQDRFEFDPIRDSNSTQISAGLKFDALALIKGGMEFGVRDFSPVSGTVPGYTGMTMSTDLTYVLLGSTRLAVQTMRDVLYSYDANQPYYVQTGVTGSVVQQIFGPFDVQGRLGAARLAYRTRTDATVLVPDRVDHTRTYGVGLGYHMGPDVRVAFNVDRNSRESLADGRSYHGLRYGTSVTYGF